MVLGAATVSEAAIRRVPARYNLLNFYGGYAIPHGEYSEVGLFRWEDTSGRPYLWDADSMFNETFYFGVDYGSIVNRRFQYLVGFRYTNHDIIDARVLEMESQGVGKLTYRTYDLNFEVNAYLLDLSENVFSPYAGAGFQAGLVVYHEKGYDSDSKIKVAGSVNFGADFKVFEGPNKGSFVTLASANSYNLFASDNRPQYLQIGGGLRYWFR